MLKRALEINDNTNKNVKRPYRDDVCKCFQCTLDGCIAFSEKSTSSTTVADNSTMPRGSNYGRSRKRRKVVPSPAIARRNIFLKSQHGEVDSVLPTSKQEDGNEGSIEYGYVYQQPIRVAREGHAMGSTLFLIIIFNLALAHHLDAIDSGHSKRERDKIIKKTLSLYQLAYNWQLKLLCKHNTVETKKYNPKTHSLCSSVTSIRFNMIIRNNLSQIHRLANDYSKYKRCLQHLLSTVMVVVEYRTRNSTSSHEWNAIPNDPRIMDLDGFLQNASSVMLGDECYAQAA